MELIEFKENSRRSNLYPSLSVGKKGAMRINREAVKKLGLKAGDEIAFYQDKKEPIDWYMRFGQDGVKMRDTNKGEGSLIFNFSAVAVKMLATVNKDKAQFRIATEPTTGGYYAILTRSV